MRGGQPVNIDIAVDEIEGMLDLEDLAPRIKELRAHQQELQKQRDHFLSSVNSEASESLDTDAVIGYVKELDSN